MLGDMQAAPGRWDDPNVLADVTAVLYASATLKPVVEAFSVPEFSPVAIVVTAVPSPEQAAWAAFTDPSNDSPADPQASRALTVARAVAARPAAPLWQPHPSIARRR